MPIHRVRAAINRWEDGVKRFRARSLRPSRNLVDARGRFLCLKGTASPARAKLLSMGSPKPGATPSVSLRISAPYNG